MSIERLVKKRNWTRKVVAYFLNFEAVLVDESRDPTIFEHKKEIKVCEVWLGSDNLTLHDLALVFVAVSQSRIMME